jgi:ATP-dependent Clp protease adaptor protein ClpS
MSEKSDENQEGGVSTLTRPRVREPSLYQVILLNDDYSTMDFVVHVLEVFFHKSQEEATRIMLNVHQEGRGACGLFPYDVAATKVVQVNDYAHKNEMPLKCVMEKN